MNVSLKLHDGVMEQVMVFMSTIWTPMQICVVYTCGARQLVREALTPFERSQMLLPPTPGSA